MNAPANTARACEVTDLFTVVDGCPQETLDAIKAYLKPFAAPVIRDKITHCLSCDRPLTGFAEAMGFGAAYRWALAHGEANCSGCGWPARGMHTVHDRDGSPLLTLRNVFLAYHPDYVQRTRDQEGRDDAQAEHEAMEAQSTGR